MKFLVFVGGTWNIVFGEGLWGRLVGGGLDHLLPSLELR